MVYESCGNNFSISFLLYGYLNESVECPKYRYINRSGRSEELSRECAYNINPS